STQVVQELLMRAARSVTPFLGKELRYVLEPGKFLRYTCLARWHAGLAQLKLHSFGEYWNAAVVHEDQRCIVFHVPMDGTPWQRWLGRQPGLEVRVQQRRGPDPDAALSEVTAQVRPVHCNLEQTVGLLEQVGPLLMHSLRNHLSLAPDRRLQGRVQLQETLRVFPVRTDCGFGEAIACEGKDISPTGVGLILPYKLATPRIYIHSDFVP